MYARFGWQGKPRRVGALPNWGLRPGRLSESTIETQENVFFPLFPQILTAISPQTSQ